MHHDDEAIFGLCGWLINSLSPCIILCPGRERFPDSSPWPSVINPSQEKGWEAS